MRDRIAQAALRHVLEPIFERDFAEQSYGFRPKRGSKDALRRVNKLLEAGNHWVVDADLKSYFDTIPHERLMARVEEKVSDGRVTELLRAYLTQDVMESMASWSPEEGTPQGAVITPPTMLQNAPFGAQLKRGWIHLKHDGDCALSNLDCLNQGSNDITFGRPIS